MRSEATKLIGNDAENVNEEVFSHGDYNFVAMYGDDWSDNFFVFSLLSHSIETAQKFHATQKHR